MITQAIKGWLQKLFAWWPWKQSTPIEYQQTASVVTRGPIPETTLWPKREGTAPQTGTVPCLSTVEDQPEPIVRPRFEVFETSPLPASTFFVNKEKESVREHEESVDSGETPSIAPTSQQRLEFLRYLVQRGIVNEGFEATEADS